MNSKAAINQVFVYLLSIIMIAFIGFLVINFISTFLSDAEGSINNKFYNEFEQVYDSVFKEWGSERTYSFTLSSQVDKVCLIQTTCNGANTGLVSDDPRLSDLQTIQATGNDVVLLSASGIMSSQEIGDLNVDGGCSCYDLIDRRLELTFTNLRNEVYVRE